MRCSYSFFVLLALVPGCDPASESAGKLPAATDSSTETSPSGSGSCDAEVLADDYDRSCVQDSDCVTVFEGPSTDGCRGCAFAAINISDEDAYLATLGPASCSESECLADCIAGPGDAGACVDMRCELGRPFACGEERCNAVGQYCVFLSSDIVGEPGGFWCEDLPAECVDATECGCLADTDATFNINFCLDLGTCEHDGLSFQVTCPGG